MSQHQLADPGYVDAVLRIQSRGSELGWAARTAMQGDDALARYSPAEEEVLLHSSKSSTGGERRRGIFCQERYSFEPAQTACSALCRLHTLRDAWSSNSPQELRPVLPC